MKVLILTITVGQGHNQVANNLNELLNKEPDIECLTLDTFEYISQTLKEIISRGYNMSAKRLPKVYGKAYRMAEKRDAESGHFIHFASNIMAKKLLGFLEEYEADVIICTQVFAAMLVTDIEKHLTKSPKKIGIITDFTVHPFWEETDLDFYITANEFLTNQAEKKGISKEKVLPIGIPIGEEFRTFIEKSEARRILGVDDKRTVLVMSGSMGYGKVGRMLKKLDCSDMDFQIISICGNNQRLKKQIDKSKLRHKVYNYGYCDGVNVFMDAADCIITKPGGLTTSEALAKGLPMIIANPIPGQEDRNVEFLMNNGVAFKVSSTFGVDEAIYQMFTNHTRFKNIQENAKILGKADAASKITELVKSFGRI